MDLQYRHCRGLRTDWYATLTRKRWHKSKAWRVRTTAVQSPGEIKRREVNWTLTKKLDSFVGPGEIKRREVVLDSHEEVRLFCGSRRDQEEGGGAGP